MISIEKLQFWQLYKNFPKNVGNLGKIIVATCFEKLPKVQQIAQPRHIAASFGQQQHQRLPQKKIVDFFPRSWNNILIKASS